MIGRIAAATAAVVLVAAPPASAHAVLEATAPARGAQLERAPKRVVFRFGEPVEAAFGAVRVYDGRGDRVDSGATTHPGGRGDAVAVALRGALGDGTYTATYRVISADSHPVSGGFVFTVGRGGAPAETLDQLLQGAGTGTATEIGFGVVRALSYLALALAVGAAAFLVAVWRPALAAVGGAGDSWGQARDRFGMRGRRIMIAAVALGATTAALALAFQGAVAGGTSFWSALDPSVVSDVLHTRFGTIYGLTLLAWLAAGALLALPVALAPLLAFLCLAPGLAGHPSTVDPGWLLLPANFVHVVSMATWVGGIAVLLVVLPAATRVLAGADRTRLLAACVTRFSTVALVAVAALVATGTTQAIVELHAFADLTGTAFGRAILIKVALLLTLVGLGAWNRQRARPRLRAAAAQGGTPAAVGVALRRSLRAEIALMVAVLAVTAALVSYAPPVGATGPFSADAVLGPARLELTVDPARAGSNGVHLYLFDRRTGRQWDRSKELTVTARLPDREISPLQLDSQKAGPGHYVIRRAELAPRGDWRLDVNSRVSAFDEYTAQIQVPIR
ncbi:MAG: copper transport protein [Thermoleophilaceae bacterium]|nr:copper transport protein [Thermoleophilaceae bacterium]